MLLRAQSNPPRVMPSDPITRSIRHDHGPKGFRGCPRAGEGMIAGEKLLPRLAVLPGPANCCGSNDGTRSPRRGAGCPRRGLWWEQRQDSIAAEASGVSTAPRTAIAKVRRTWSIHCVPPPNISRSISFEVVGGARTCESRTPSEAQVRCCLDPQDHLRQTATSTVDLQWDWKHGISRVRGPLVEIVCQGMLPSVKRAVGGVVGRSRQQRVTAPTRRPHASPSRCVRGWCMVDDGQNER